MALNYVGLFPSALFISLKPLKHTPEQKRRFQAVVGAPTSHYPVPV